MTSRNPLQVASIAQTLLSTRPVGSAISRSTSSVMSVSSFDARLGQAIHRPAAGSGGAAGSAARVGLARGARPRRSVAVAVVHLAASDFESFRYCFLLFF